MKVEKSDILKALSRCIDPEVAMSVLDLGMIERIDVDDRRVVVTVIFPGKNCPFHTYIAQKILSAVSDVPGVSEATVEIDWTKEWNPDSLSEQCRAVLFGR